MKNRINNHIVLDENSIWVLEDKKPFSFSDGQSAERYLKDVLLKANDLSSMSLELEGYIKDWPSEYHLTGRRSNLLRGFNFDTSKKVLEVGCGCGAITRFLGETFDDVVAIEGSMTRARLARMRTKDLDNVSILCAPFHEIDFKDKFDIIFCIGVFEYSSMFVDADDPFNFILEYFQNLLSEDGMIVLAIENQFGLKYFLSCSEDHTNVKFDGIEGYPRYGNKVKTFGYNELKSILSKYFKNVVFFFPYPDYKVPICVLSEIFISKAKLGELIGNYLSRDYSREYMPLFDERLTLLELDKNNMLPFFANAFLVIAGRKNTVSFDQLGLIYSKNRIKKFQTVTRFVENLDGSIQVIKSLRNSKVENIENKVRFLAINSRWIEGLSIQGEIIKRVKEGDITLEALFAPCKIWVDKLISLAFKNKGKWFLDGKYIDCIWSNSYIENKECAFSDLEWEWKYSISLNVILIRSIYQFLIEIMPMKNLCRSIKINTTKHLIKLIGNNLGVILDNHDFIEFHKIESELMHTIYGKNIFRSQLYNRLFLYNKALLEMYLNIKKTIKNVYILFYKLKTKIGN